MAAVNVLNISVLNNPGKFTDKLAFEITFECVTALTDGESEKAGGTFVELHVPCAARAAGSSIADAH